MRIILAGLVQYVEGSVTWSREYPRARNICQWCVVVLTPADGRSLNPLAWVLGPEFSLVAGRGARIDRSKVGQPIQRLNR